MPGMLSLAAGEFRQRPTVILIALGVIQISESAAVFRVLLIVSSAGLINDHFTDDVPPSDGSPPTAITTRL